MKLGFNETFQTASWGVFAVRLGISSVVTAGVAWGVSVFWSDYVVAQRFSSIETTLSAVDSSVRATQSSVDSSRQANTEVNTVLSSSIDRLNQSVISLEQSVSRLNGDQGKLLATNATQTSDIGYIKQDVSSLKDAVRDAGINVVAMLESQKSNAKMPIAVVFADSVDADVFQMMTSMPSDLPSKIQFYELVSGPKRMLPNNGGESENGPEFTNEFVKFFELMETMGTTGGKDHRGTFPEIDDYAFDPLDLVPGGLIHR